MKVNNVTVAWAGEHRFDGGKASGGPRVRLDAGGTTGPGPVDGVLISLASCTGVDVVDILAKRRTHVESMNIDVRGERADGTPARLVKIEITFHIRGAGIEREHAERAVELAVTKYCSVRDSLDPKIPVGWTLDLG